MLNRVPLTNQLCIQRSGYVGKVQLPAAVILSTVQQQLVLSLVTFVEIFPHVIVRQQTNANGHHDGTRANQQQPQSDQLPEPALPNNDATTLVVLVTALFRRQLAYLSFDLAIVESLAFFAGMFRNGGGFLLD
uniref:(northern house mosquito) hypothetical protein n=1 Tax=Culex pipiens TaxID=7175 RepID=A0A8D8BTE4_CULPI